MRTPRVCIFCIGNVNNMVATNQIHYLRSVGCLLLSNISHIHYVRGLCVRACISFHLCLFAQSTVNMYPLDTITNEFIHLSINFESLRCVAFASARFIYLFFTYLKVFFSVIWFEVYSSPIDCYDDALPTSCWIVFLFCGIAGEWVHGAHRKDLFFSFLLFFLRPDVDTIRRDKT